MRKDTYIPILDVLVVILIVVLGVSGLCLGYKGDFLKGTYMIVLATFVAALSRSLNPDTEYEDDDDTHQEPFISHRVDLSTMLKILKDEADAEDKPEDKPKSKPEDIPEVKPEPKVRKPRVKKPKVTEDDK